jgi:adenylate kinase family enzyme
MNIVIFGPPGSGKTTLAKKISSYLNIPNFDLDDIYWKKKYNVCLNSKERDVLLHKMLDRKDWVVEGVYIDWVAAIVKKSDLVIILNISKYTLVFRLIKRFIKNKFSGKEAGTLKNLFLLMNHSCKYKNKNVNSNFYRHLDLAKKYSKEYKVIKNKKEIDNLLSNLRKH